MTAARPDWSDASRYPPGTYLVVLTDHGYRVDRVEGGRVWDDATEDTREYPGLASALAEIDRRQRAYLAAQEDDGA